MRHAQEVNDDMWRQGKNGMRRGVRTSTHIGLVGALTASAIVAVPIIVATSAAADASGACPTFTGSTTTEYTTAGDFTFNVPATASLVCVEAVGGRGGSGSLTGTPGLAGFAGGAFPVTASSTLAVQVAGNASGSTGGANGGGRGNTAANFVGGGGGGASQVKSGTTPWLVAAGGAGGGQFAGGSGGNQTPVAVSGLGTIAPGSGGLSSASQGGTVGAAGTSAKGGDGGKGTKLGDWGGGGGGGGNGGGGGGGGGSLASPATNPAGGVGGTAAAGGSGTTAAGAGGPGGGMYSAGTVGAGANGTGNQVSAGGAGYGGGGGGGAGRSSGGGGSSFVKNTAVSSSVSFASAAADSTPYVNITTYTLYSDLASYDFGDQAVPSTTTQAFTITNATASSTTIGTVSIGGAGASQFDLSGGSDTCSNQTLASGSTCTVSASFVPTAAGEHAGELQVPSGAGNIAIPLTGTGLGPNASPSPSDFDFGPNNVGTTTPETFTITNSGTEALSVSSVVLTGSDAGEFSLGADTCTGMPVAADAQCTIVANFVPTATGAKSASVSITSDDPASPTNIPVTGIGTNPGFAASPDAKDYGSANTGTTTTQTFTITNNGPDPLAISAIALTGDDPGQFALPGGAADTCTGQTLAARATCTVDANFVPTTTGSKSADLAFTDDGGNHTIALSGTGTAPGFSASPASKDYGSANTGTNTPQTFTITNNGDGPLTISTVMLTGDDTDQFSITTGVTNTCAGQTIAASATCTVEANFAPTTTGAAAAELAFTDNAGNHTIALSGTGTEPGFSASPASKDYGSASTGTTTTQTFTITNNGDGPLTINAVGITGTNANQFTLTGGASDTCTGQTIAASAACTVEANFVPTVTGAKSASISFTDNAGNNTITLTGTGTAPGFSASPASKDYGYANTGTTTAQTFTITNSGDAPLTISTVTLTGDDSDQFSITTGVTNTCAGQTVAASTTCTVEANFVPTTTGAASANLAFTDNAGNHTIALSGTGTAPGFSASPSSKDYGSANTGTTNAQTFTITNNGTGPLTISAVTLTGDNTDQFSITTGVTNTCASQTIAASATCTVEANFVPTTTGAASANLAFTDNAGNHTIALSGTGTAPGFSASPSSKDYGSANTGTTNAQTFTITNNGTGPLTISAVTLTGDNTDQFSITTSVTNTCASQTIAASATCTVEANFVPTTTGAASANLAFTDNAGNHTIALSGTGTAPGFSADPASRDFSSANTGTTTAAQVFTITNDGDGPLTISAVGLTGANANQFSLTGGAADTCTGEIIAATATCEIEANFAPTTTGAKSATVSFTDNAGNHTIALSGTGTAPGFSADPASKDYSNTNIGTTATAQTFTITNDGDGPLTISAVTLTGANANQFTFTGGASDTCSGQTIAASATCQVEANFAPTTNGAAAANISFTDNAGNNTIALTGTGTSPGFTASPASKDFGSANTGTTATAQVFTITNNGDGPLTISAVTLTGANANQFTFTGGSGDTCTGQTIAASATCEIEANFAPTTTGAAAANIAFTDNAGNNTIALTGTGTSPEFSASPASKDYGSANTGTTTTAQTFTITNNGDGPLTISTVTLTGANANQFTLTGGASDTCSGQTIAASATCEIEANFAPTTNGAAAANISFTDNAGNNTIALTGTGTTPGFTASPAAKDFGSANTGTTATAQVFTITNNGDGPLTISAVTLTGANANQFTFTGGSGDTCTGQTIAASATCEIEANFAPTTTGAAAANIAFTDNAGNNTIALTGTGTSPEFSASPASKDYGSANTGTTATAQTFTITNTGDAPLTISAVTLAGANPGQFTLADGAADTCTGQSIIPSATCEVKATFSPTSTGAKTASITFTDNAGNNTIDLAGTSTEPGFSADPESKDFGSQSIATTTTEVFTITNDRDGPLTISAVGLTGANPNQFALTGGGADTCTGQTIAAAQTCEVEASFSPTSTGTKTANISFTDNAGDNSITLSGTGTAGVFSASPSSKEFGAQEVGTTTAQMFTVTNTGDGPLIVSAVDLTGMNPGQFSVATGTSDTCSGQTLAPFDTCTVEASFSPTSSGDKSANLAFTDSDGGHDVALSGTGESTNNLPPELVLECPTGSCAGVDLRGINLAGVDASGVDFKGANLAGANLTQTQLVAADFRGADLVRVNATSADFRSARMQRARFSKPLPVGRGDMVTKQFAAAKLTGANFRNANLTKAIMEGVDIRRANLRNVRADRVKLSFAKVQRANFSGAGLRYGNFSNANCARASFARADLFKARFTSANLKGATFRGAKGLKTTFR